MNWHDVRTIGVNVYTLAPFLFLSRSGVKVAQRRPKPFVLVQSQTPLFWEASLSKAPEVDRSR